MRVPFLSFSSDSLCLFFLLFLCFVRFPVILRRFHLNPGTGGNGFHRGGDGVIRELLFRRTQVLSVLSERRAFRPYGMSGMTVFFSVFTISSDLYKILVTMNGRREDWWNSPLYLKEAGLGSRNIKLNFLFLIVATRRWTGLCWCKPAA